MKKERNKTTGYCLFYSNITVKCNTICIFYTKDFVIVPYFVHYDNNVFNML